MTNILANKKIISILGLLIMLILFPLIIKDAYILHIAIITLIYCILATSLNLMSGYTGLLSLGHQAFYGIGGYTSALLMLRLRFPFILALLFAGLFSMISAWFVGKITFRLRSAYFTISTIAFAKILELVCVNWIELTEGPMGIIKIPLPSIGGFILDTKVKQYYLILTFVILCIFVIYKIINSHVGRVFRCVEDSEYMCKTLGVNVNRYLMIAMMVSGSMAGIAGALYAHYVRVISPDMFYFAVAVNMVVMVVAGGKGTIIGPIIGAIFFTVTPEYLRFSKEYSFVLYGVVLIITTLFLPGGIVSLYGKIKKLYIKVFVKKSEIKN